MNRRTTLILVLAAAAAVLLTATAPASAAGWKWSKKGRIAKLGGSIDSISCPTVSLCVAAASDNKIHLTTNPKGKAKSWSAQAIAPLADEIGALGMSEVDCPTAKLCIVGDSHNNIRVSTNPLGGVSTWRSSELPSDTYVTVTALSCASDKLCGLLDIAGLAMTTNNPAGFGNGWAATRINPKKIESLYDISCVGTMCAAVQSNGNIYTTADATQQPAQWTTTRLGKTYDSVSCGTPTLCVTSGFGSNIRVATNPFGSASAWKKIGVSGASSFDHVYCKSGSMCFGTAGDRIYTSKQPTKGSKWGMTYRTGTVKRPGVIMSDVDCPTTNMCVAVDVGGSVYVGTR